MCPPLLISWQVISWILMWVTPSCSRTIVFSCWPICTLWLYVRLLHLNHTQLEKRTQKVRFEKRTSKVQSKNFSRRRPSRLTYAVKPESVSWINCVSWHDTLVFLGAVLWHLGHDYFRINNKYLPFGLHERKIKVFRNKRRNEFWINTPDFTMLHFNIWTWRGLSETDQARPSLFFNP